MEGVRDSNGALMGLGTRTVPYDYVPGVVFICMPLLVIHCVYAHNCKQESVRHGFSGELGIEHVRRSEVSYTELRPVWSRLTCGRARLCRRLMHRTAVGMAFQGRDVLRVVQ